MFRFEKLDIWKLAIDYGMKVYDITDGFPKTELFALTSQLRRAALSISSNIAEGSGSPSTKEFCYFLDVAIKSAIETVSQLQFAKKRDYITNEDLQSLYREAEILVKKIQSLKQYLKKPRATSHLPQAGMEALHE